jgi:hypothetical protein
VAPHSKRSRSRSRKRGRAPTAVAAGASSTAAGTARDGGGARAASARGAKRERSRRAGRPGAGSGGGLGGLVPAGKRPPPPWHPLPLSEILILFGAIGTVVGLSRGVSHGGPPLIAGLAAVVIGTLEVTLREHLSGYRSHTIILAALPVIVLDAALVLALSPLATGLRLALLAINVAVFALVYKLLRARFLDARRERVFSGR